MDADDPLFTPREIELLRRPSLRGYVVTAEHAARRYESLGVDKPWVVIPQGVNLSAATPELRERAARRRKPGEVVLGWMAAHLLTAGDRDSDNPLYNVDHLLELWEEIHAAVPNARLWLVGSPSDRLRERVRGRTDIELTGRLPRPEALATASCFDVAPYARTADQGIRAAKVSEFIGLGVPTVSYDYEVTSNLRETGAGLRGARRAGIRRRGRAAAERRARPAQDRSRRGTGGTGARLGSPRATFRRRGARPLSPRLRSSHRMTFVDRVRSASARQGRRESR